MCRYHHHPQDNGVSSRLDTLFCCSFSPTMFLNALLIIMTLLTWNNVGASTWWNGWSPNNNNDRYQKEKLPVTLATTKTEFKQLWYTKLYGAVQESPTVYEQYVYVSTYGGMFYCLQADHGTILWQRNLSTIINNSHIYISRTSPLVYVDVIVLGLTDVNTFLAGPDPGPYVIAFNRFTGVLLWKKRVSTHPASILTGTPQLVNNRVFIGISSIEESFANDPTYPCCTFQGSVVALDARTGKFLWETKMIPDNNGTTTGYSGAAVWGSQFPVDQKRKQIYVATGNYYKVPVLVQKCLTDTSNLTLLSDPCNQPGAYGEAIVALDMDTGVIRWNRNLGSVDAWTEACIFSPLGQNVNCPPTPGTDVDFGQAPILKLNLPYKFGGENRDQLFVGQKSGIAYGLDAETGTVIWSNQVSPGSINGGIQFGSAADDQYLYVGNNNDDSLSYTLPNGIITTKASWSALDLETGDIKWTTVDPTTNINKTSAYLPLTVWNKLVLVQGGSRPGNPDTPVKGCLYGLNKKNGEIVYEKCIGNASLGSGASVARNIIYVGVGYGYPDPATDGVLALKLPVTKN